MNFKQVGGGVFKKLSTDSIMKKVDWFIEWTVKKNLGVVKQCEWRDTGMTNDYLWRVMHGRWIPESDKIP